MQKVRLYFIITISPPSGDGRALSCYVKMMLWATFLQGERHIGPLSSLIEFSALRPPWPIPQGECFLSFVKEEEASRRQEHENYQGRRLLEVAAAILILFTNTPALILLSIKHRTPLSWIIDLSSPPKARLSGPISHIKFLSSCGTKICCFHEAREKMFFLLQETKMPTKSEAIKRGL